MRRCRRGPWDGGAGGVHKGHFHNPAGMVVRGGKEAIFIRHRGAFVLRQMDSDILGAGYPQGGGWQRSRRGRVRVRERLGVGV